MATRKTSSCLVLLVLLSLTTGTQAQTCGLDIVFALDGSSSLFYQNWVVLKNVVSQALGALIIGPDQAQVGICVFATTVTYVSPQLSTNKAELVNLVNNMEYPDTGTFTNLAITASTNLLRTSRPNAPDVLIIITDGATETKTETAAAVQAAMAAGITIYAIGLGSAISRTDLELLTGDTNRVVSVSDVNTLLVTLNQITERACREVTTTTPAPTTTTPPPPVINTPVCPGIAPTNIWLLNDMSSGAEGLATRSKRFDLVQEAVTAFVGDPSLTAASSVVKLGLVNFNSAGSRVTRPLTTYSSAKTNFFNVVPDLGLSTGTYSTTTGLRTVKSYPEEVGADDWVVLVTSIDSTTPTNTESAVAEAQALVNAGYKIYTIGVIGPDNTLSDDELNRVSASGGIARITNYRQLTDALGSFVQTKICPVRDDLCALAKKRNENDTTGFVYHPTDCDKFIQCHFYEYNTVAVYRTCPLGQYWNHAELRCDEACYVDCPYEKCHKPELDSYKMEGSCRAYWRCSGFKSVPACCAKGYSYVPGYGCQNDPTCQDFCGHVSVLDGQGVCNEDPEKKATVMYSRDADMLPALGSRLWHLKAWFHKRWTDYWSRDMELCDEKTPRPYCDGDTFDLVTCQCAPKNLTFLADTCQPTVDLNFADSTLLDAVPEDLYDMRQVNMDPNDNFVSFPGTFGSLLHLRVEDREGRPLAFTLRYRENSVVQKEVALVRSTRCDNEGALYAALTPENVKVEIISPDGKFAATAVSTLGFSATEWKNLTVVYDGTSLTLSVRTRDLHYVSRVDAPKVRCFTCGVDVAPGSSMESFSGDLQLSQVSYCYPHTVEADPLELAPA